MSTEHIIRAWRDEEYRESLNAEQSAVLPESPIGAIELSDHELAEAEGGLRSITLTTTIVSGFICAIIWWPSSLD
jgi:mersacidin/lichenicidin family type 2 lantibiotic